MSDISLPDYSLFKVQSPHRPLRIAIIGATGLVGQTFLRLLGASPWQVDQLCLFSGSLSAGSEVLFRGQSIRCSSGQPDFSGIDLAFFSSGEDISKQLALRAVQQGAWVIDNSSAFRMDASVPLVVPSVNRNLIPSGWGPQIIANPNCTTIQLVEVLGPLREILGLNRVWVSSYQAVSGAGREAVQEWKSQVHEFHALESGEQSPSGEAYPRSAISAPTIKTVSTGRVFSRPIAFNCLPEIGAFAEDGDSGEELKVRKETRKILSDPLLRVSSWAVRVPVPNAHAMAVWVEVKKTMPISVILERLSDCKHLVFHKQYPIQSEVSGSCQTHVGRFHFDPEDPQILKFWVVADNLIKGAASNALDIASCLIYRP